MAVRPRSTEATRTVEDPCVRFAIGERGELTGRTAGFLRVLLEFRKTQWPDDIDNLACSDDLTRSTLNQSDCLAHAGARSAYFPSLTTGEDAVDVRLANH